MRITAFAVGLAIGIGAGTRVSRVISFGIPENSVTGISGILLDDPRLVSGGRAMTTLSLKKAAGAGGIRTTAKGEITVFFPDENSVRLKEFGRGTEVFAEGDLRRSSTSFIFTAQNLHVLKTASGLERFRTGLRLSLEDRILEASPDTASWGGLVLALLLGIRDNLDTGLTALYREAGCSYLLALSGMHLAVLIALISFVLKKPLGLRAAAITGSLLIFAYYFLIGPLPSLNRAVLMYFLGVLAVLGMLKKEPFSLLCMAFLVQLIFSPKTGVSVSFFLSYLALSGIIIIGAMINNIFRGIIPPFILNSISASLGAFIATAGVSSLFFGDLRPVGIVAGLILAPLVTVFMIGALIWLGIGALLPGLSPFMEKLLSFIYLLMEKSAAAAGYVPGIRADHRLVIILSLLIVILLVFFDCRRRAIDRNMEVPD